MTLCTSSLEGGGDKLGRQSILQQLICVYRGKPVSVDRMGTKRGQGCQALMLLFVALWAH